jgi:hypothetical protein
MNDLLIPSMAEVPSYILNPELARQANDDAAAGISTGMPPRLKLSGKQFTLVDANGDEAAFPAGKMVIGPDDNAYLPMVILRAKKPLQKTWYATAFNPGEEGKSPDCFSTDNVRPDPTSPSPQSELCANCPHNAFGSGTDQNGNATKGKACSDTKTLAVFIPGSRKTETDPKAYMFKIPPASLKNFGMYVKQLSAAGIPLGTAKTLVAFDLAQTFPVVVFKFGGFLPQDTLPKLAEIAALPEVEDIIAGMSSTPALPAPSPAMSAGTPQEYQGQVNASEDAAKADAETKAAAEKEAAIAKTRAEAAAKSAATKAAKKAEKEAAEAAAKLAAAQGELMDDLDLGGTSAAPVSNTQVHAGALEPSDDQLIRDLGL